MSDERIYTYSITGEDDGSGERFASFSEAKRACLAFLHDGADVGDERLYPEHFQDWMVVEAKSCPRLLGA